MSRLVFAMWCVYALNHGLKVTIDERTQFTPSLDFVVTPQKRAKKIKIRLRFADATAVRDAFRTCSIFRRQPGSSAGQQSGFPPHKPAVGEGVSAPWLLIFEGRDAVITSPSQAST